MSDWLVTLALIAYGLAVVCAAPFYYGLVRQYQREKIASESWWKEWREPYRRPW